MPRFRGFVIVFCDRSFFAISQARLALTVFLDALMHADGTASPVSRRLNPFLTEKAFVPQIPADRSCGV